MALFYSPHLMLSHSNTSFFIPIPGVMLALLVPDWSYVVNNFPQFLCSLQNQNLSYYSSNLLINILIGIGVLLFVLKFWKLHKVIIIIIIIKWRPRVRDSVRAMDLNLSVVIALVLRRAPNASPAVLGLGMPVLTRSGPRPSHHNQ